MPAAKGSGGELGNKGPAPRRLGGRGDEALGLGLLTEMGLRPDSCRAAAAAGATASVVPGVRHNEGHGQLGAGPGRHGGYSQRPDDHRNRSLVIGHTSKTPQPRARTRDLGYIAPGQAPSASASRDLSRLVVTQTGYLGRESGVK